MQNPIIVYQQPVQLVQYVPVQLNNPPPYNPSYTPPFNPSYNYPSNYSSNQASNPSYIQPSNSAHIASYIPPATNNLKVETPDNWNSGLCSCCEDFQILCCGLLCPCCLYARNSTKLEDGSFLGNCLCYLLCIPCCQQTKTRYVLRQKYKLLSEPCNDCLVSCFCPLCGLCQEAREINFREQMKSCQNKPANQIMN